MENELTEREERSEIELKLLDALRPGKGLLDYIGRTSGEGYTAREALDIHHNRFVLTGINLAYVAFAGLLINLVYR